MALAHYQGYVENVSTGKALEGAVVRVYSYPGNILQSTFADLSSTPKPVVSSDSNGGFDFYIADGAYDIEYVVAGDVLSRLVNVPIYNPANNFAVSAQTIEFVATASQTVFNFPAAAAIGFVSVFLNGVRLKATDFAHSGTTVTLVTGATVGDTVTLEGFTQSAVPDLTSLPLLAQPTGSSLVGTAEGSTLNIALLNRSRVLSVLGAGGSGNAIPAWTSTTGTDDSDEVEALINQLRNSWNKYSNKASNVTGDEGRIASGGPALYFDPGRFYLITRDMPAMPPGSVIRGSGAVVVIGANNIRVFWTEKTPTLPNVAGGTTAQYGNLQHDWELPIIHCNGYAGTFVDMDTWQRGRLGPTLFTSATGSSYTVSGALVNAANTVGLTPADYAKVKKNDIIDVGENDAYGNPVPYKVISKSVINSGATDRSYGRLLLDDVVTSATGNYSIVQLTFPMVWSKVQQSIVERQSFISCDWSCYHGINDDDVGGTNDVHISDWCEDYCQYGMVWGRGSNDATFGLMSMQYNYAGSHLIVKGVNLHINVFRTEFSTSPSLAFLKPIPAIVMGTGCRLLIDVYRFGHNDVGRYMAAHNGFSTLLIGRQESVTGSAMPVMPDGSYAPFVKPGANGLFTLGTMVGVTGPVVNSLNYSDNPRAWITNGAAGQPASGFSAFAVQNGNVTRVGEMRSLSEGAEPIFAVRRRGEANDRTYINGDGRLYLSENGASAAVCNIIADASSIYITAGAGSINVNRPISRDFVQVVGARKTGWGAPTGTATRTTFDTTTVTLPQLAERVKALLDDLNGTAGHGLIGT